MGRQGEALGIPELEFKAKVRMPSTEFQRVCRDMTIIGDTVAIDVKKTDVKFSVSGETGKASVTTDLIESCSSTFALRYLNHFAKATPLSEWVTFSLAPDLPLMVEYEIEKLGYIRYFLAPKIDEP